MKGKINEHMVASWPLMGMGYEKLYQNAYI